MIIIHCNRLRTQVQYIHIMPVQWSGIGCTPTPPPRQREGVALCTAQVAPWPLARGGGGEIVNKYLFLVAFPSRTLVHVKCLNFSFISMTLQAGFQLCVAVHCKSLVIVNIPAGKGKSISFFTVYVHEALLYVYNRFSNMYTSRSIQSARLSAQSSELRPPHPLTRKRVLLPPFRSKGGDTLVCGWGVGRGDPIPTKGHADTLVLYVYVVHTYNLSTVYYMQMLHL